MEYEKFCEDCGEYFTTTRKGAKFCRSCLLEHMAQANRNAAEMKKFKSITTNPREAFNDILAEIERFNKENSRHLSYGQYVALRFLESQKRRNKIKATRTVGTPVPTKRQKKIGKGKEAEPVKKG